MDSVWPPSVELDRICTSPEEPFGIAKNMIQAVFIFATELNFTERASESEHQLCRAGERGSR